MFKTYRFVAFALLAAAAILTVATPSFAMPLHDVMLGDVVNHARALSDLLFTASPALLALRTDHADLVSRAALKIKEVTDGMAPDAVRKIEQDHADLLRQADDLKARIATEEARIAALPPSAAPADQVAAERTRSASITDLALRHAMPEGFATQHIKDGTSLNDVRALVLDEVAKRAAKTPINSRVQIVTDEGDTLRTAVENAIVHRANPSAIKLDDAAREWRGMTLLEMGRTFIEQTTGERVRGLGKMDLASRLLGLDNGLRAGGAMATSDFPAILANVAANRLRNAYEAAPQNWKVLGRQSNAPDFKQRAVVQLSNLPKFKKVREGAEFQYAALSEGKEVYSLGTYGRIVAITRQTLINDDLGAFDRLPTLLGRAAAETEAGIFWSIITSNAAMGDGVPLFHADHKNLLTGAAISVAALGAGRAAMRKQVALAAEDADPLNVSPKYLVVGPDLETDAQQFLADIRATEAGKVNPFVNSLVLVVEARLSGDDWYLFADPSVIDTIEYAWLDGEEGLFTEQRLGFEIDGIEVKGRIDFAAKAIDHRGVQKNPGLT